MGRVRARRTAGAAVVLGLLVWLGAGGVPSARAFEALEGNLQVHGFFEVQLRTLARDFDASDNFDLAQWYNVLNIEIDYDIAPDGWGPFTFVSSFARIEARFDCIYSRGCGAFPSIDVYGDRAEHLPQRLSDARERGFVANIPDGDARPLLGQTREQLEFGFKNTRVFDQRSPGPLSNVDGFAELFGQAGPDGLISESEFLRELNENPLVNVVDDDPANYVFENLLDFRFAARDVKGPTDENGIQMLGPWLPENTIRPVGVLSDRANPFRGGVAPVDPSDTPPRADGGDTHPVITFPNLYPGVTEFQNAAGDPLDGLPITPARDIVAPAGSPLAGSPITDVEKPFRMAPNCAFDDPNCPKGDPRGLFIPSPALREAIRDNRFGFQNFDQNFREAELALNRGASQQDEKELKELYLDLELLDSALWLRIGKQNIVWGKTELFRTTDQFNPQDFAIATLPDLEESRIANWAIRGVYSFYEVGPLQDLRLELAMNYDQFEPVDIGRCGEPFAVNLVCLKAFGLFAHGVTGIGLAGEERPPDPWNSFKGIEVGGRLEFRWGRFSFQISDFYGYRDFPILERLFTYERNVDPNTGLPRRAGGRGPCRLTTANDGFGVLPDRNDPDCLQGGQDALFNHSANQTLFAVACAATIGFNLLEPSTCALSTLNSRAGFRTATFDSDPTTAPSFFQSGVQVQSLIPVLEGGSTGKTFLTQVLRLNNTNMAGIYPDLNGFPGVEQLDIPLVRLVQEGGVDAGPDDRPDIPGNDLATTPSSLSAQQEALLGCGPFFEVPFNRQTGLLGCFRNGIDLLNAEASALVQSWPGFDGWDGAGFGLGEVITVPVPGTQGFVGGPVATGTLPDGTVVQLPGARGPFLADGSPNPAYDPLVDGTPPNAPQSVIDIHRHPFACTTPGTPTSARDPNSCQLWNSEFAAVSWNFLVTLVMLSGIGEDPAFPENQNRLDFFDPLDPFSTTRCSFAKTHLCANVQALWSILGTRRNTVRAGGRNGFGRRDFAWHQGGEAFIRYEKRNVLGFAMDFAEDVTKSNWGVEMTWIEGVPFIDNDEFDGLTTVSTYNMTISVDRPTFVNFLNANRTFFFNSQWFFQYVQNYSSSFPTNGPFNVLGTFTIITGYFQDRLLPQVTFVYDVQSNSGGLLSRLTYRLTERFSATIGINAFLGRFERVDAPINDLVPTQNRVGRGAHKEFTENLLSLVRERDEAFLLIRYTY